MKLSSLVAILGLALITALGLPAQSVRVIFTSGAASIQRPDETAPRPIVKGESVIIGSRITTGADGRVVLTPMPGVRSIIAPNTTLTLESSSENKTSETNVTHKAVIDLKEGAVVTDLNKPEGVTYDYSIRTARGLAGARGTTFTVGINAAGIQTIVVSHGTISINFADGRVATLTIGNLSIASPTGEPKSVGNVSELPPADKNIAQNWVETTISAIASAIEAGVDVDPQALKDALAAAKSLGIELPPELQALVDRVLALLEPTKTETDTKTVTEVVTDETPETFGFASIDAYLATLSPEQKSAFDSLRAGPSYNTPANVVTEPEAPIVGYTDEQITLLLRNGKLAAGLTDILNMYVEFKEGLNLDDNDITTFLTNLGILGNNNFTAVGSDSTGLRTLILAYYYSESYVDQMKETDFPKGNNQVLYNQYDVFFPGEAFNNGGKGVTIYDVTFENNSDSLRIGATRNLLLDGVTLITGYYDDYYEEFYGGKVELRAADLVSLNNVTFGPNVTDVLVAAATINLSNLTFNEGSYVKLFSKFGEANFGSSKFGYVNFIKNVNYGSTAINATTLPTLIDQEKVYIGTLEQSIYNNNN